MRGALCGLLAGLLLAVIEALVVAAHDHSLFLSARELGRYALLAALLLPPLGALLGASAQLLGRVPGMRFIALGLGTGLAGALLWSLTEGRRVRDLAVRPIA